MPHSKVQLDFNSKKEDVINRATDKRTQLATKKVPYPTPAHKIFDGIPSNKKVKKKLFIHVINCCRVMVLMIRRKRKPSSIYY